MGVKSFARNAIENLDLQLSQPDIGASLIDQDAGGVSTIQNKKKKKKSKKKPVDREAVEDRGEALSPTQRRRLLRRLASRLTRAGELLVRVQAIPFNLNDLERITGGNMMVRPEFPYAPGMEVLGVVVAGGAGARPSGRLRS